MQTFHVDLGQIAAAAGAVGSLVTSIVLINKRIVKPVRSWLARADTVHRIVSEQLTLNGGKSLKDSVMRLESLHLKSQADLQAYFSLMTPNGVAMFEADSNGRCTSANGVYKAWTGSGDEDLLGEAWLGVVLYDDREMVHRGWNEAVRDRRDYESYHRMIDAQGVAFWVHCYAVVRRLHGTFYGYIGRIERTEGASRPQIC